jgi:hypothetical protein
MFVWFAFEPFDIVDVFLNSLLRSLAVPRRDVRKISGHHSNADPAHQIGHLANHRPLSIVIDVLCEPLMKPSYWTGVPD